MRFLIDNAPPTLLAELPVSAGQDAAHGRPCHMQASSDEAILATALAEDRIVVPADTDFAATLVPPLIVLEPGFISACAAVSRRNLHRTSVQWKRANDAE